jgi:hypothetical protein
LHSVYFLGPECTDVARNALVPLARVRLPQRSGTDPVHVRTRALDIDLLPGTDLIRLRARAAGLRAEFEIRRPKGHESLGVVVPWSHTRFQYTVKENTLPATGEVIVGGRHVTFDDAYATLDHGRGKWPYSVTWNWGAGSGRVGDRVIGIQVGGAWTDGTGSTENAVCVDGRIHHLPDDLRWEYDPGDWMRPWRITDPIGSRA